MIDERGATRALRRELPHAWPAFLGRFGRLRKSQLQAMPHVLEGRDIVLLAPTASGKTEALMAPVAEGLAVNRPTGLAAVYVVPTRALANDIERRIRRPLEDMNVSCRVRTGERKEGSADLLPAVLITTPESLDSLLSRAGLMFKGVRVAILDELHLVDNTYRGDQLRALLSRLKDWSDEHVQTLVASATLDRPDEIASRYAPDAVVLNIGGSRDIQEVFVESAADLAVLLDRERRELKKVLCFGNTRRLCEERGLELRSALAGWQVFVHHGSVPRADREAVERGMREGQRWLCVATPTLEVGIDIGDVDAVVLLQPPLSVSSLLQRIGRANRRGGVVRVIAVSATGDEHAVYEEQLRQAREGLLSTADYELDLSVVVQQSFSMVTGAPGGLADGELRGPLVELCGEQKLDAILRYLVEEGHLFQKGGDWFASSEIMDAAETGKVYSNIPGVPGSRSVVDTDGRAVGEVGEGFDSTFTLQGKAWEVVSADSSRVTVRRTETSRGVALFPAAGGRGAFTRYLPSELR